MFWDNVKQFQADKLVKFIQAHDHKSVYSPQRNKIRCVLVSWCSVDRLGDVTLTGDEIKIERINDDRGNGWKISYIEDIEPTIKDVKNWLGY